jgi:4-hydroxy-2-oxoglutarate aldolase
VNSDMLAKLGQHPNIVGVKLTCGGIAKVARVAAQFSPEKFCALAGQSDWLLPAISVGGTGTITGLANLYPKVSISCLCNTIHWFLEQMLTQRYQGLP